MTRAAHCCCRSLSAEATGEASLVCVRHCTECQRRTGSAFGVSTYFAKDQVRTEGPSKVYVRGSESVWEMTRHPWVNFDHQVDQFTDQLSTPATPATS